MPNKEVLPLYNLNADWFDENRSKTLFEKFYLEEVLKRLKPGAHILDLGCGTAEPIAQFFIEHDVRVTGVDGAENMIRICEKRYPDMRWIHHDMRTLDLGERFDAVIAWDSFFHLPHADQKTMFAIFAAHSHSGAPLLFTSGAEAGEVYGKMNGHDFYHASLDTAEYRALLMTHGFSVITHVVEDPTCGGRTVWLAEYKGI